MRKRFELVLWLLRHTSIKRRQLPKWNALKLALFRPDTALAHIQASMDALSIKTLGYAAIHGPDAGSPSWRLVGVDCHAFAPLSMEEVCAHLRPQPYGMDNEVLPPKPEGPPNKVLKVGALP